ncbi:MAG TPA: GntR family transcriptional regulator [Anaerolineales bacterium]|nr:GntR family transcriptional regulator [Anaerolineales bacterium]
MASELRRIKTTNEPLHYQAQFYLRDLIQSGAYQPGQKLPPEGIFAEKLGISRPTLREALYKLEIEGLIIRKHGVGTYVSPSYQSRLDSGLEVLESIEHIAHRMRLKTEMGNAQIEERAATPAEAAGLECDPGEQVLSVMRIILVGEEPVAHLSDVLPISFMRKQDLGVKFRGSVLDILLKRGQPALMFSFTRLAAIAADNEVARQLQIPRKTPLLKMEAKLFTRDNLVVDYSVSKFVSDFFDFHVIRRIGK